MATKKAATPAGFIAIGEVEVTGNKGRPLSPLGSTFDTYWAAGSGSGFAIMADYSEDHENSRKETVTHTVNRSVLASWAKNRGLDVSISGSGKHNGSDVLTVTPKASA